MRTAGSAAQIVTLSNNASSGFIKSLGANARGVIVTQVFPNERAVTYPMVKEAQELARVGAEGLHIPALPLGIQRVEHQAGFAGAAGARHHRQFAGADVQVQVLEVVLACAADSDQSLGHGSSLSGVRRNILGTNRGGRATRRSIPGTAVVLMLHCRIPQGTVTVKRWP